MSSGMRGPPSGSRTGEGRWCGWRWTDARQGGEGIAAREAADLLVRDYGVTGALDLDGGGSTSLAMENPATGERRMVNVPSREPGRAAGGGQSDGV
jgi:hypothetical protein